MSIYELWPVRRRCSELPDVGRINAAPARQSLSTLPWELAPQWLWRHQFQLPLRQVLAKVMSNDTENDLGTRTLQVFCKGRSSVSLECCLKILTSISIRPMEAALTSRSRVESAVTIANTHQQIFGETIVVAAYTVPKHFSTSPALAYHAPNPESIQTYRIHGIGIKIIT